MSYPAFDRAAQYVKSAKRVSRRRAARVIRTRCGEPRLAVVTADVRKHSTTSAPTRTPGSSPNASSSRTAETRSRSYTGTKRWNGQETFKMIDELDLNFTI